MFCPRCGSENRAGSKFCMSCGVPLTVAGASPPLVAPAPPAAAVAALPSATAVTRRRLPWRLVALILGILALLGGGAYLLLGAGALSLLGGDGNTMLLAFPDRNGEVELYLVPDGQPLAEGTLLAEDALPVDDLTYYHVDGDQTARYIGGRYATFVPGTRHVLFWYREAGDDDALVKTIRRGENAATELLATNAFPVTVSTHEGRETIYLGEQRDDQRRCYSAGLDAPARRLTKGATCGVVAGGSLVYVEDLNDDELTVSLIDVQSGSEEILLDSATGARRGSLRFSEDGSHVAYGVESAEGIELFVMDRTSGETVSAGAPQYDVLQHGFIPKRDVLYYLAENDNGDVELYLSNIDRPIARGTAMSAQSNRTGQYLQYLVGDKDGENTAYLYNMGNGDVATLMQEEDLRAFLVDDLETIFLWEIDEDEFTLYSVPQAGGDATLLFEEDGVRSATMSYTAHASWIFLDITDTDGKHAIYVAQPGSAGGFYALEEWESVALYNVDPDGSQLLLASVEDRGDDPLLMLVSLEEGTRSVEMDSSSEGFINAVFSANGRDVLYTAKTGNDDNDLDVLRVAAAGDGAATVLHEGAQLDAVSWAQLNPFRYVSFQWTPLRTGSIPCPAARALAAGDEFQEQFEDGATECYRFRLGEGDMATFDLSNLPEQSDRFRAVVEDRDGQVVAQVSMTREPWLTFMAPEGGLYFLKIDSDSDSATYRLRMADGNGEPAMAAAEEIEAGETRRGAITIDSQTRLLRSGDQFYGDWYYLDAAAGDDLTIEVSASSLGSEVETQLHLFDPFGNVIAGDDGGGPGSDDSLDFRPPETARYYLLVRSRNDADFGSEDSYFYELAVNQE